MGQTARQRSRQKVENFKKEEIFTTLCQNQYFDNEIAELLGLKVRVVEQTRSRIGIAPKWGSQGGHEFTPEEDEQILHRREKQHFTIGSIARDLGIAPSMVMSRYELLVRLRDQRERAAKREEIPCIKCRTPFITTDRKRDRYCGGCRKWVERLGTSYDI